MRRLAPAPLELGAWLDAAVARLGLPRIPGAAGECDGIVVGLVDYAEDDDEHTVAIACECYGLSARIDAGDVRDLVLQDIGVEILTSQGWDFDDR